MKNRILILVLLLVVLTGCTQQNETQATEKVSSESETSTFVTSPGGTTTPLHWSEPQSGQCLMVYESTQADSPNCVWWEIEE